MLWLKLLSTYSCLLNTLNSTPTYSGPGHTYIANFVCVRQALYHVQFAAAAAAAVVVVVVVVFCVHGVGEGVRLNISYLEQNVIAHATKNTFTMEGL